jgi:hypothetical protein
VISIKKLIVRHSIHVNCEGDENAGLTPEQLWEGLMLKLTAPQRFDDHIERCDIQWISNIQFIRELQYPAQKVEDKVTLNPHSAMSIQSLVSGENAFSLVIEIKTSLTQQLTVYYEYTRPSAHQDGFEADKYLAEAYRLSDEATIQKIKSLVSLGELA